MLDVAVLHQLTQHPTEALFSELQNIKESQYRDVRVSTDKIDDAVMRTAEFEPAQNRVRMRNEVALGLKLYLYALVEFFFAQEQGIGARSRRRIHG